jgi:hypothetical protein
MLMPVHRQALNRYVQAYAVMVKFSLVAFFALSIYWGYNTYFSYKEYIPTYFNGDALFQSCDSLTDKHKSNIQKIFAVYDVQYKVENGRVYYRGYIDKELLWNYTTKANDIQLLNRISKVQ